MNCLVHDTFRGSNLRLSINSSRSLHLRLKVPETYVTGDRFGVALSDAKINALLKKYAEYFKKPERPDQISLSDDDGGNDGGARGFSAGAGATTRREVVMDANAHSKSVSLTHRLQRERNKVSLQGYAAESTNLIISLTGRVPESSEGSGTPERSKSVIESAWKHNLLSIGDDIMARIV